MRNPLLPLFLSLTFLALLLNDASAESPERFDIQLSGDAFNTLGYVRQNTDVKTVNYEAMNRFRLSITPKIVADNGISYGARMRLRASMSTGTIDADQAFLFTQGYFGQIEAGTQYDPAMLYHVIAPSNFGTGGIDGDWAIGDAGWLQNQTTFLEPYPGGGYTVTTFVKGANRLNYISPRFFSGGDPKLGLMGTASYAPVNRKVFASVNRSTLNSDPTTSHPYGYGHTSAYSNCGGGGGPVGCNYRDIYELGLRYDELINDITVRAGLGYIGGNTGNINFGIAQSFYNLSSWQAGIQLGMSGFLIGGSYANAGKSSYPRASATTGSLFYEDQYTWTAGISYETGPVSVGFNYEFGHDAGDLTAPGARTANILATGVTYILAPGLSTALEYLRSTTHNESGYTSDALGFSRLGSGNAHLVLWKTQVAF